MKKRKLIGLASLMLALGVMAGCGDDPGDNPDGQPSAETPVACEHEYEFKKIDDSKHQEVCKKCGDKKTAKSHSWVKDEAKASENVAATCEGEGTENQKCKNCEATRVAKINPLDHDWVDDEGYVQEPGCETTGLKNQHCSRCTATKENVEVPPNDHTWGEWTYIEGKEPTCDKGGQQHRICSACQKEEKQDVDPLGHDTELIGAAETPTDGKAAVRVYKCKRCNVEFLGFKASEASEESKSHLRFTDPDPDKNNEVGASFFGRPIGNSLALDANGKSVNEENNEIKYCRQETGDFFEYKFELDETQANLLSTCRLYCDAKPADHLSGDFWAYNGSATDWTPGYYIDDQPEHIQHDDVGNVITTKNYERATIVGEPGALTDEDVPFGKRIEDYRYALYVDNVVEAFDKDTTVTVEGSGVNTVRKEYVLPYTFNLHKGVNTIRLVMAGGYRSTFYNFIFRPYVAPTPIEVAQTALEVREGATIAITGAPDGVTYKSSNTSVATVADDGTITGVKPGTATITVSKEGNYKDAKVTVTVLEKEGVINLNLTDAVIAPAEGGIEVYNSSSSGQWYRNPKNGTTLTYNFQSTVAGKFDIKLGLRNTGDAIDLSTSMGIKVNDVDVAVAGSVKTSYDAVEFVVGQADLKVGDNTMVISFPADSALYIKTLKFSPADEVVVPPEPVHEHVWTAAADPTEGATDAAVKKYTCECGKVKYEIAAETGNFVLAEDGSQWKTEPTTGSFKLDKTTGKAEGSNFSFTFALPKAFSGKMYQRGYMDQYGSNKTKKVYYQAGATKPNIEVTINNALVDMSEYSDLTFDQIFGDDLDGTNSTVKDVPVGDVNLLAANAVTYKRTQSLNMIVSTFVFIGTEAA